MLFAPRPRHLESHLLAARHQATSVRIYPLPQGEAAAAISITAGGQPLPVSMCSVSAYPYNRRWPGHQRTTDQREVAYFARLAGDRPITFRYTPDRTFSVCTVRPLSARVVPTVKDGTITFTLPHPGGYSVELDGLHNTLHPTPARTFSSRTASYGMIGEKPSRSEPKRAPSICAELFSATAM